MTKIGTSGFCPLSLKT